MDLLFFSLLWYYLQKAKFFQHKFEEKKSKNKLKFIKSGWTKYRDINVIVKLFG